MAVATRAAFMGAHQRIHASRDIAAILGEGGVDCTVIPIGDRNHENAGRTTVTTTGQGAGEGLIFTYSEAIIAFDAPPTYLRNQLWLPDVPFNGTDEEADTPDAAFWSQLSGGVDAAFSVGAWVNLVDATISTILGKYDGTATVREWVFHLNGGDDLELQLYDESANVNAFRNTDVSISQDVWVFLVATYDGRGGDDAATGITIYVNGASVASTAVTDGLYVDMEDTAEEVTLGMRASGGAAFFDGRMRGGALGKFLTQQELTASQVARLYRIGVAAQG